MHVGVLSQATWNQFQSFFVARGVQAPPMPSRVVFACDDTTGHLIAGVCLYPTDGPYLFLEHFSYAHTLTAKEGAKAIKFLCAVVRGVAAVDAKTPMLLTGVKGIADLVLKEGFLESPVRVFYAPIGKPLNKSGPPDDQDRGPLEDTATTDGADVPTVPQGSPKGKPDVSD